MTKSNRELLQLFKDRAAEARAAGEEGISVDAIAIERLIETKKALGELLQNERISLRVFHIRVQEIYDQIDSTLDWLGSMVEEGDDE